MFDTPNTQPPDNHQRTRTIGGWIAWLTPAALVAIVVWVLAG